MGATKVEHPLVATIYDAFMLPQELLGVRRQRVRTAGAATGTVLELGVGTGGGGQVLRYDTARVAARDPGPSSRAATVGRAWPLRHSEIAHLAASRWEESGSPSASASRGGPRRSA